MRQVLQSLKKGTTEVTDVPCPVPSRGEVLIRSSRTLVSAGTERMLVDFGKAGLIGKARQQPERVKQVLDKVRSDGLVPTIETVLSKLDQPLPLGYCNVGTVMETGSGVSGLQFGDRVVSNGKHAEAITAPINLCARVPDNVSDDEAAFAVLGAIALQGIRLVQPSLGEAVFVTGLGVIGLLTVQLLRAHGCRVLAADFDPARLQLARQFGASVVDLGAGEEPVAKALQFSRGRGMDAVLITASTQSSEPVHQAALMSRQRGRIVLVGVTGLELSRSDFYEKELTFQVSCSYGPGRYDPNYEQRGHDYPVGFVRWTEQRNFEAVLDMMADGRLDVKPLISHRFPVDQAEKAYALLATKEPSLGILLEYHVGTPIDQLTRRAIALPSARIPGNSGIAVGFIGSGNYATAVLIPAFKAAEARLVTVASSAGVSGVHAARKFGFESTTTDASLLFENREINAVVIATRHDSHADLVCRAIEADKHVFVEKPIALTKAEIESIEAARDRALDRGFAPIIMVGFNRRFAPHVQKVRDLLASVQGPHAFIMTVNAGAIPSQHWSQDPEVGGGRIIGEACHFVDLLRFLAGSPIKRHATSSMTSKTRDTATIQLEFANDTIGTIHYFANGSKAFPKERLEVFAGGRILQLDNFRRLWGYGWPGFRAMRLWRQNKGQNNCASAFTRAVTASETSPIPYEELIEVARVTVEIAESIRA